MPEHLSFRGIADDLTERIRSGQYPEGTQLPSTVELADMYSVSRSTIVRAVALLHDRGLIYGEQGRGMFVGKPTAT
jgi:GntR family transcriptional regulator